MTLQVALRHAFGAFALDVAFEAPPGLTALFGRSGSGKTTVVNTVAGLLRPHAGRVALDGTVLLDSADGTFLPRHRRHVGYVFQEGRLFPHLTVRQNLAFGRWFAPRSAPRADLGHVVELLGISHLLDRRPGTLSGGEKQRVAVGRALLASPQVLLMDEPLAALDALTKLALQREIVALVEKTAKTILYVTHDIYESALISDRVLILSKGPRSVIRHDLLNPVPKPRTLGDPAVAAFVGELERRVVIHGRL
jgi:molybdate transport system ATP-binding protein